MEIRTNPDIHALHKNNMFEVSTNQTMTKNYVSRSMRETWELCNHYGEKFISVNDKDRKSS